MYFFSLSGSCLWSKNFFVTLVLCWAIQELGKNQKLNKHAPGRNILFPASLLITRNKLLAVIRTHFSVFFSPLAPACPSRSTLIAYSPTLCKQINVKNSSKRFRLHNPSISFYYFLYLVVIPFYLFEFFSAVFFRSSLSP